MADIAHDPLDGASKAAANQTRWHGTAQLCQAAVAAAIVVPGPLPGALKAEIDQRRHRDVAWLTPKR